jgi:hypothetical protein
MVQLLQEDLWVLHLLLLYLSLR